MSAFTVSISRLSLNGFTHSDARRIAAGFEAELARMQYSDAPQHNLQLQNLATRTVSERSPEHIGADAARALVEGLHS